MVESVSYQYVAKHCPQQQAERRRSRLPVSGSYASKWPTTGEEKGRRQVKKDKTELRDVAVIIVHGITVSCVGYSSILQRNVLKSLPHWVRHKVQFHEVFWANCLRPHQAHYQNRARHMAGLKMDWSRKIAISALGDAAAYQKGGASTKETAYVQIQEEVTKAVRALDEPNSERPLVLIGHSLGCHILSSFLWDTAKLRVQTADEMERVKSQDARYIWTELNDERASAFRKLETIAGIITFGNNMPLFAFNLAADKIQPITQKVEFEGNELSVFPGSALPRHLKDGAQWINMFDPLDPLGFPLRPLSREYENSPIKDVKVRNLLAIPYFGSHTEYWRSHTVAKHVARLLKRVILVEELSAAANQ